MFTSEKSERPSSSYFWLQKIKPRGFQWHTLHAKFRINRSAVLKDVGPKYTHIDSIVISEAYCFLEEGKYKHKYVENS
jgi:hypothetical protein